MSGPVPQRIVVTGDILRPLPGRWAPAQGANIRWLARLVGQALTQATGLATETLVWRAADAPGPGPDATSIGALYDACGVARDLDGWARLHEGDRLTPAGEEMIAGWFEGALVIGFELPPVVAKVLERRGIPFIDAIMHPVRFLDDVFFGLTSNDPAIREGLVRHATAPAFFDLMAGVQGAGAERALAMRPKAGSLLFLFQVPDDKSLIRNGALVPTQDCADALARIAEDYRHVYLKTHPLDPAPAALAPIAARLPAAELVDESVYGLLASEGVAGVASLSSSATFEARHFAKRTHFMLGEPYRLWQGSGSLDAGAYVGVVDGVLASDFWRDVLRARMAVTATDGLAVPFKPNRLRISLGNFWGFNRIDTDVTAQAFRRDEDMRASQTADDRMRQTLEEAGRRQGLARIAQRLKQASSGQEEAVALLPVMRLKARALRQDDDSVRVVPGAEGHVIFGPYLALPEGRYRIACRLTPPADAPLLARLSGQPRPWARVEVALDAQPPRWMSAPLSGDRAVSLETDLALTEAEAGAHLEIRVAASAGSTMSIDAITLTRL